MRALQFDTPSSPLRVVTVPDPVARPGTVVLRVTSCGICGTDIHRCQKNEWTFARGTIPGHEFSGEVVVRGSGVTSLAVGARVAAQPFFGCGACVPCRAGYPRGCPDMRNIGDDVPGALAEYVLAAPEHCVELPDALSDADGALIEPLAVGLRGVGRGRVGPGDRVVVMGAGPVGLACVWWARRLGADVVVVASSTRRQSVAEAMGASGFFVHEDADTLSVAIADALDGTPDAVFECVGLPGALDRAVGLVGFGGRIVSLGACAEPERLSIRVATRKEVEVTFSSCYDADEFHRAVAALSDGDTTPRAMVSATISLEEAPDAIIGIGRGAAVCKVLVDPRIAREPLGSGAFTERAVGRAEGGA